MKIGVLGAGQLGRMLALAGIPLDMEFRFFDPSENPCAESLGQHFQHAYDDNSALAGFVSGLDAVTCEFENVPLSCAESIASSATLRPGVKALSVGQDRLTEKTLFSSLGIDVGAFAPIAALDDLAAAASVTGFPAILKTRRMGYDGKGQARVNSLESLREAWNRLGQRPSILEALIPFDREISCLAVRNHQGEIRFYPVAENTHRDGILRLSIPRLNDPFQSLAEQYTRRVAESLDYVGVIAFEFFVAEQRLLGNEIAPRVHNSGHWSIEGASTSQFENHLRAVADLPLGDTELRGHSAMVNCIGQTPRLATIMALPGIHVHYYGKAAKPGRKVGHLTVTADRADQLDERLQNLFSVAPELAV